MLTSLYIKNYALIAHLELEFTDGFMTFTGQTGSGKSIMLGALSLVLGARADKSVVLTNTDKCVVEVHFKISDKKLKKKFDDFDIDFFEHTIFRREVRLNGKSRSFINDMPVSLNVMKEIGLELIDIHSQHQTLKLHLPEFQLEILDLYANNSKRLIDYKEVYDDWKKCKLILSQLVESKANAISELDYVQFQLKELNEADIENENLERLQEKFRMISSSKEILESLENAQKMLNRESGMLDQLHVIMQEFDKVGDKHHSLDSLNKRLKSIKIELQDIEAECDDFKTNLDFDPLEAEMIQSKLDLLNHLLFKHHLSSLDELMEKKNQLEKRVLESSNFDERIKEIENRIANNELQLIKHSEILNENRRKAAGLLESRSHRIMSDLNMKSAKLRFSFSNTDSFKAHGADQVQLEFSPDAGKTFLPIHKVASGGEISRVMLALKSLLAQKTVMPTVIFDEIDTGVSGEVASQTATILKDMSSKMQVIAITHLPQVAALGDVQYLVSKEETDSGPATKIQKLNAQSRVNEIAKMLSASEITEEAIANAKVLLSS